MRIRKTGQEDKKGRQDQKNNAEGKSRRTVLEEKENMTGRQDKERIDRRT